MFETTFQINQVSQVSFYFVLACLIFLGGYFVIAAYRHSQNIPWAFLLVLLGVLVAGHELTITWGINEINVDLLLFVMIVLILIERERLNSFFINQQNLLRSSFLGFFLGLGVAGTVIVWLNTVEMAPGINRQTPLVVIFIAALSVAFGEELLFRGFLLGYLRQYNFSFVGANLMQDLLFTILHLPRYLITENWIALLYVGIFGFLTGYLTWRQKNVAGAIVMHGLVALLSMIRMKLL